MTCQPATHYSDVHKYFYVAIVVKILYNFFLLSILFLSLISKKIIEIIGFIVWVHNPRIFNVLPMTNLCSL
jgi:hypothetical protein